MSARLQFDLHPDAELLNGFVENELRAEERTQILDHLASCERCREVVFVSQSAAVAALAETGRPRELVAAAPRPERDRRPPRFNWWQFAWVGAAALVCVVAIAVTVQLRRSASHEEVARELQSRPLVSQSIAPLAAEDKQARPVERAKAIQPADSRVVAVKPDWPMEQAVVIQPRNAAARPAPAAPPPAPLVMNSLAEASVGRKTSTAEGRSAPGASYGLASGGRGVGSDVTQQNQTKGGQAQGDQIQRGQVQSFAAARQLPPTPAGVPAAGTSSSASSGDIASQRTTQTVSVAADSLQVQPETTHSVQYMAVAPGVAASSADPKKSGLVMLPSGLPLVSTAAAGRTTLAIDAVGSLFLSSDLGRTWEPVAAIWKGKATKVRLAQPASSANGVGGALFKRPKAKSANGAVAATALFEILDDKNEVWTSADGKTWSPK